MFKKKTIILSFDYELFFGDCSGTVQKSLIEPTNQLLDAMDSVGFKGNFFIDWQMIKYLSLEKDERCQQDYAAIVNQLKDMVRRGHRIELHIHPHWVDAKYNGDGTWNFSDFSHYSLNKFNVEEIIDIFKQGVYLLTSIAREVDTTYKLCAFRAGGWAVQPFEKVMKGMEEVGIYIDSSAMPGYKITCEHSKCDFTNIKHSNSGYYKYSNDVCIHDPKGKFTEVPITTAKPNIAFRILRKIAIIFKFDFSSIADGTHVRSKEKPDIWEIPVPKYVATFSSYIPICSAMFPILSDANTICYIDHPKDFSKYTVKGIKLLSLFTNTILYKDIINE